MQLSLNKLPWYGQLAVFVILSVAATGVFYYFYATAANQALGEKQAQLDALNADIRKGQMTARKLPEFRRDVDALRSRLETLRQILPEQRDVADLLRKIQTLATQSNLTIKSFKPAATKTKQFYAEWPIELELDGTYHNLGSFFDKVGNFSRIINVSDVKIKSKDKPAPTSTISATCTATTFVFLESAAASAKPGAPGAAAPKPGGVTK